MRTLVTESPHSALIERCAMRYDLPPVLVAGIIEVESGGDTWAVRYEEGFYDRYVRIAEPFTVIPCTKATERRLCATSFGLMQVMGQVARERGFKGPFLTQLCDPELGIEYGCRHLAWTAKRLAAKRITGYAALCAAYNGGVGAVFNDGRVRNPEYPAKVLAALGGSWDVLA